MAKKLRKRGDTNGGASFEGDDDVTQVVTGVAKHGRTRENRTGSTFGTPELLRQLTCNYLALVNQDFFYR